MGRYVEKNIRANERLIAKAEISWVPMIPFAIAAVIVFIIGLIIKLGVIGFLAGAFIVVCKAIHIMSVELGVTDKKIIGKTGVFVTNSIDAYLERIDSFSINESFAGMLFGYSTIQICTTSAKLRFHNVKDAVRFKNLVMNCIEDIEDERFIMQAKLLRERLREIDEYQPPKHQTVPSKPIAPETTPKAVEPPPAVKPVTPEQPKNKPVPQPASPKPEKASPPRATNSTSAYQPKRTSTPTATKPASSNVPKKAPSTKPTPSGHSSKPSSTSSEIDSLLAEVSRKASSSQKDSDGWFN